MARKNPNDQPSGDQRGTMLQPLPWWAKVLVAVSGIVVIYKFTPIFDLLSLFFYVFVVPMCFVGFAMFGMSGALEGLLTTWAKTKDEIKARVTQKVSAAA